MSLLHARRGTLLGFATGALVLLSASAAFACTQTAGKVTMTGTMGATGSGTYQGNGTDDLHPTLGYCTPPARTKFMAPITPMPKTSLNFKLDVSVGSCARPPDLGGGTADPLTAGVYDVRWIKSTELVEHTKAFSCFGDQVDPGRLVTPVRPWTSIGSINVTATGPNIKEFVLKPETVGAGNICLQSASTTQQIQAPMLFITWI